jgi:hypothetical protein
MRNLGRAPEVNALDARDWAAQSHALEGIGQFDVENVTVHLDGVDAPISVTTMLAGAGLTSVLGIQPMLGRGFVASDFSRGAVPVVVLGQRFWRQTFGADRGVAGRRIGLGSARATIVGVWPDAADRFPAGGVDLWTPLVYPDDSFLNQRGSIALGAIGRLTRGADVAAASAELSTIARRLARDYPETNAGRDAIVEPLQEAMVGPVRPMLIVIALSIAAVLAIACANIANLLLAQTCERSRELAVRSSLEATRSRLVRQLMSESLGLYVIAGAIGIAIAPAMASALLARYPDALPLADAIGIDGRVLLIAIAVTLGAALLASGPRLRALGRRELVGDLSESARGLVSRAQRRTASLLIVAQVALSIVLLLGATSLLRTFLRLSAVSTGFDATRVVSMRLTLPSAALVSPERTLQFQNAARDLAVALPGVERAAHAMFLPFTPGWWHDGYERVGRADVRPNLPMADFYMVSPDYLATLGVPIRRGRDLRAEDDGRAAPVVVVSETFAARAFPGERAVGRLLRWENRTWEIVAVAADTRHGEPVGCARSGRLRAARATGQGQYVARRADLSSGAIGGVGAACTPAHARSIGCNHGRPPPERTDRRQHVVRAIPRSVDRQPGLARAAAGGNRHLWRRLVHRLAQHARDRHSHGSRAVTRVGPLPRAPRHLDDSSLRSWSWRRRHAAPRTVHRGLVARRARVGSSDAAARGRALLRRRHARSARSRQARQSHRSDRRAAGGVRRGRSSERRALLDLPRPQALTLRTVDLSDDLSGGVALEHGARERAIGAIEERRRVLGEQLDSLLTRHRRHQAAHVVRDGDERVG